MTGYFTAGIFLCVIGEPMAYDTCFVLRSPLAYPSAAMCEEEMYSEIINLPRQFNMEELEIIDIRCIEWLPEGNDI